MLPVYIVSKYNIRPSSGVLYQWLNISVRLCSSSESSSDSDSDTEKVKRKEASVKRAEPTTSDNTANLGGFLNNMIQRKSTVKAAKDTPAISSTKVEQENATKAAAGGTDLMDFVNNMLKARRLEKTIDVAIQPRKSAPKKVKSMSYEKKLVSAAEDVADKLGGDKAKTTSDLLQKALHYEVEAEKKDKQFLKIADQHKAKTKKKTERLTGSTDSTQPEIDLIEFIKSRQITQSSEKVKQESSANERRKKKESIIHNLLQDYYKKQEDIGSVTQQLIKDSKTLAQQPQKTNMGKPHKRELDIWNGQPSQAFAKLGDTSPDTPVLKTWAALEQRELKALTTHPPANIFQEIIFWTEQGKLWKFPIDNEQGMEEEQNIHFSEHVFMERHLKGWCPTSGPIRHFMELVCVGLSKNPYMTVQEKVNHIMWYRDYFKSKEQLLQELGAIQEPFPDTEKQIAQ